MIKATLNSKLRNKIKDTFDRFEPEYKSEYWQAFQLLYVSQKKQAVFVWTWIAKAAIIVLFLSILPQKFKYLDYNFKKIAVLPSEQIIVKRVKKEIKSSYGDISSRNDAALINRIKKTDRQQTQIALLNSQSIEFKLKDKAQIKIQKNSNTGYYFRASETNLEPENKARKNTGIRFGFGLSSAAGSNGNSETSSYGGTLTAGFKLSKKLSIRSGISIEQSNTAQKSQYTLATNQLSQIKTREQQNIHYFSVPLAFSYQIKKNIGISIASSIDYLNKSSKTKRADLQSINSTRFATANADISVNSSSSMSSSEKINKLNALTNMKISLSYFLFIQKNEIQIEPFMQIPLRKGITNFNTIPLIGINLRYNINLG